MVKDAADISVKMNDGRIFKARVVGKDPRKDVALVSFETRDAVSLADLGDSNSLEVGDIVFAVGNPLGFTSSVTMGIVSALGRSAPGGTSHTYTDYIQTDAAINQGNSGRRAGEYPRPGDRNEYMDCRPQRRERRARVCHPHQQRAPGHR